jgi:hypothetical protein
MARHPRFNLKVSSCSFRGAQPGLDPEFGTTVQWDVPLVDGYDWVQFPNTGNGGESFWGLWYPGLWKLVRGKSFDALICLTGYQRASFWLCCFAVRSRGIPFFFGTDTSSFEPREPRPWKRFVKRLLWGCPVMVSDRVSAARDVVASVAPLFIFPHCDVDALAMALQRAFVDPLRLRFLRVAVRAYKDTWSPKDSVVAVLSAIEHVHALRQRTSSRPLEQNSAPRADSGGSHPISR